MRLRRRWRCPWGPVVEEPRGPGQALSKARHRLIAVALASPEARADRAKHKHLATWGTGVEDGGLWEDRAIVAESQRDDLLEAIEKWRSADRTTEADTEFVEVVERVEAEVEEETL